MMSFNKGESLKDTPNILFILIFQFFRL